MPEQDVLKSKPAGPEKESWFRYRLQEEQETPKRLEDAAKFLATMISVSLAIFLSDKIGGTGEAGTWSIIALSSWILSLVLSFFVLFPFRYRYSEHRIDTFRAAHEKIVRVKRVLLILSLAFFLAALLILMFLFICKV